MKLYHYSAVKFDVIDMSKCDGFWMTDIAPENVDMLNEIGAEGLSWVAVVDLDDSGEALQNAENHDVEANLKENEADYVCNKYDGFTDYAVTNENLVKILEWKKVG